MDFSKTKYAKFTIEDAIHTMLMDGYKQISRKYKSVSRVDIPIIQMKQKFIVENFGDETSGIPCGSIESQKDYYRRCCSKDVIDNVPENIIRHLR